ncbi:MAG: TlpA family protein disulfide reductase [Thermoplasmata archaeon]|nr:MAG: TlpA family protein disulfide reductase [Thermoplasmata archaeon]
MAKRARNRGKKKNGRRRPAPPPPTFMEQHWRTMAIVVVVFAIVAIAAYAVTTNPSDDGNGDGNGPPPTNEAAPNFLITSIDGEPIALDQFRGKVVVLDLMATWCGPCVTQMDHLNQLRAHYPESQVVILSIGVDTKESNQQLREFRDNNHANWRFARDIDGVGQKYDASNIPTMVVVDKEGLIASRDVGVTSFEDLKEVIDPLL